MSNQYTVSAYTLFIKHKMLLLKQKNPHISDDRRFLIKASHTWNTLHIDDIKNMKYIVKTILDDNPSIKHDVLAELLYNKTFNK